MRPIFIPFLIPCAFAQQPVIKAIVNAASEVSAGVAPQMIVAIYGTNLSTQTATANQTPLPPMLAGTSVSFNGIAAPLLYVSATQINAQVPTAMLNYTTASVIATSGAGTSDPFAVIVSNIGQPGIFTQDASGCGQAAAFNIHPDGSLTMNTPDTSLDAATDVGLAVFLTGLGAYPDRMDGVPWQYSAKDNDAGSFYVSLGIPNLYKATTQFQTTYAGPAPGTIGIDQINAAIYRSPYAVPLIEGCHVPMAISFAGEADTQYVNVSIHSGGGKCVDAAPDSMGIVTWNRTATSDSTGVSSDANVTAQFLQAPGLALPQSTFQGSFGEGPAPPTPAFCAASYPSTLSAGNLSFTASQLSPATAVLQNQSGVLTYAADFGVSAALGGASTAMATGANPGVGSFTATTSIPAPITVTTDLSPGTTVSVPFTVKWTGGDNTSAVTVQLITHGPVGPATMLYDSELASAGSATVMFFPDILGFHSPINQAATATGPATYEVVVTQTPARGPAQTFTAPGLSLGGQQTWHYIFDFKGLTPAPASASDYRK